MNIDDRLFAEAKRLAAASGRTLTSVVEDGLREIVMRSRVAVRAAPFEIPTVGGGWVRRGVDIHDTAAVLDVMEGRD